MDADTPTLISVLDFAHKYDMKVVFQWTLDNLAKAHLEPFDKLLLCDKYEIPVGWALDAVRSVSCRETPLDLAETKKLSKKTLCILLFVREKMSMAIRPFLPYLGPKTVLGSLYPDETLQEWVSEAQI